MHFTTRCVAFFAFVGLCAGEAYPPPAQGPPAPPAGATIRSIPVTFITANLENTTQDKLAEINTTLAARTDARAKISLQKVQRWSPRLVQTKFTDRPNHRFVEIPYIIEFRVFDIQVARSKTEIEVPCTSMPQPPGCAPGVEKVKVVIVNWDRYPFDRTLYMSLDVNAFCTGWEIGKGKIELGSDAQRPYIDDDPSPLEAVLNFFLNGHLIEFVNSKIRQALVVPGGGFSQVLGASRCNSLQAAPHGPNSLDDDDVEWSEPPVRLPQFTPAVTVRPLSVKRLKARQFDPATGTSGVLYEPVESPGFHFWAGFNRWFFQLPPMMEEQVVALAAPAIKALPTLPGTGSLVVLAGTEHRHTADSNFAVFSQSQDYGNGIRKIVIQKTYTQQAKPPRKPTKWVVDAYEVTFEVFHPLPGNATTF